MARGTVKGGKSAVNYKAKKDKCATDGCGNKRRPGQGYCRACHAKRQRDYRAKDSAANAEQAVARTLTRVSERNAGRGLSPEMREKIAALAQQVVKQIEQFNAGGPCAS